MIQYNNKKKIVEVCLELSVYRQITKQISDYMKQAKKNEYTIEYFNFFKRSRLSMK